MLRAEGISFQAGQKRIVDTVSLDIKSGEFVAVVGPNGAGKSTLLKLLTGDLPASSGYVSFLRRPLSQWAQAEVAKRRGVLMQQNNLSFAFTVFEVVLMGRMPHNNGVESDKDVEIVFEALESVGLVDYADRIFPTLSGGEQQRVHLARILAQIWEPPTDGQRLLLLDEPTASLDIVYQQQVLQIARQFANQGTAVLAILHDLNLAAHYADNVMMLKNGRVTFSGPPAKIFQVENIQQTFDVSVMIIPHPKTDKPLVTYLPDDATEVPTI
ncbi:MAG: heme ABC transporter ATP-binding protein [Chloroflexota bacterium]